MDSNSDQNQNAIDFPEFIIRECKEHPGFMKEGSNDYHALKSKLNRIIDMNKVMVLCEMYPQFTVEGTSDREQWLYWTAKMNIITDACIDNCTRLYPMGSLQWQACVANCP